MRRTIFVIDDDPSFRILLNTVLSKEYDIQTFADAHACLKQLEKQQPSLVITDYAMPETNGLEFTQQIKEKYPSLPVLVLTAYGSVESAVEVLKAGAFHYLEKTTSGSVSTANFTVLKELIRRGVANADLQAERDRAITEVENLKKQVTELKPIELVGNSSAIKTLRQMIEQVAAIDSTVLIRGETGTGKNLAASLIHKLSRRDNNGRFVEINCASLPETLLETELFGHEQGAFTDARSTKKGLFEIADHGTIFLDEIDSASMAVQSKLLSVLETRSFRRVGGVQPISVDVRLICATNASLEDKVTHSKFREDLFYRINVVSILMPPLRELGEDIITLAEKFTERFSHEMNKPVAGLSAEAKMQLLQHNWKGNVRELRNVIERAVIFTPQGQSVTNIQITPAGSSHTEEKMVTSNGKLFSIPIGKPLEDVKLAYIQAVLKCYPKSYTDAAKVLGISAKSLWEIRKRYSLETNDENNM
ncbi:MAG: sigma-54-dependent Fis family transcriptional regulator [Chlorobiales bacterium]|nr:sigma-54-dependent Fis family transcriptional regulator [Chlorobiales bacterium]